MNKATRKLIALLRHDVRLAIFPQVGEWNGQQDVSDALRGGMNALGECWVRTVRSE